MSPNAYDDGVTSPFDEYMTRLSHDATTFVTLALGFTPPAARASSARPSKLNPGGQVRLVDSPRARGKEGPLMVDGLRDEIGTGLR